MQKWKPFLSLSRLHLHPVLVRRHLLTSAAASFAERDPLHEGDHFARVPDRGVLELEGPDTVKFLQGLITNHMPRLENGGEGFYAGFLTPQGRLLYDVFIHPLNLAPNYFPHPVYLLDCAQASLPSLHAHLRRYLLRSKVKLRDATDRYALWSVWGPRARDVWEAPHPEPGIVPRGGMVLKVNRCAEVGCRDPRWEGMGLRVVVEREGKLNLPPTFTELPAEEYTLRRILHGIPEGVDDLWPGQALPLESNFDYMGGVDFRKGCYVGQELTIRTYHTGVVRKRIVPVALYRESESPPTTLTVIRNPKTPPLSIPPPQSDIRSLALPLTARPVGRLCSSVHNVALALMRLDHVYPEGKDVPEEMVVEGAEGVRVGARPFLPEWWPCEKEGEGKDGEGA